MSRSSLPPVRLDLHVQAPQWETPICLVSTPPSSAHPLREEIRLTPAVPPVPRVARRGRVLVFVFVVIASLCWASSAAATQGGYGPGITGPTGPANAPGGYSDIVATHTFGATGGVLGANVAGGRAHLTVPKNAFGRTAQVEITTPGLSGIQAALQSLGFGGFSAIGGIGVKVYYTNGKPFVGNFAHALTLTITGPSVGSGDRLIKFTSPSSATLEEAVFSQGSVTLTLLTDPDFAILAPTTVAAAATTPPTASASAAPSSSAPPTIVQGEQFTRPSNISDSGVEGVVLATVVLFWLAVLLVIRRRRTRVVVGSVGNVGRAAAVAATGSGRSAEPRHSTRAATKRSERKNSAERNNSSERKTSLHSLEPKHARR
jgi:hypothetical protein